MLRALLFAAIGAIQLLAPVFAQVPEVAQPKAETPATDSLGRSTPRGTVVGFLRAARAGDLRGAAEYLDLRASHDDPEELAEFLHEVLDRSLSTDLAEISLSPDGKMRDGVAANREVVGSVKTGSEVFPIELERIEQKAGVHIWLFSSATLEHIPSAFASLEAPAYTRRLPSWAITIEFLKIPLWRWFAAVLFIGAGFIAASLINRPIFLVLRPALNRITRRDDEVRISSLRGPLRMLWLAIAMRYFGASAVALASRQFWMNAGTALTIIAVSRLLMQFSDVGSEVVAQRLRSIQQPSKLAVLDLARRLFKVSVAVVAFILLLQRTGVNVSTMIAGLGVGGIALALAAQKTLENTFGGITVILRDAIHVGEFCKISGQMGTVEDIGIGSTRIRTLDRTVVSVPNAQLSQLDVENVSVRDKFWFHPTFGLRYDTSPQQMRAILAGIDEILRGQSEIEPATFRARFTGFGPASQTIEIFAYILASQYDEFLVCQEKMLLSILDVITAAGASLAVPLAFNDSPPKKSVAKP